ncbi:MAG: DNA repair protein RadC [Pseudomonadota bacterium]|nr:DNA repair protein RadC [Pseudomonadota bacterium]
MNDEGSAPHYLGHRQRLKEKYLARALEGFHDYEIMELLLTYGIPRKDVKGPAKQLIKRFGGLKGVLDAGMDELREVPGITAHSAVLVKLVKDIGAAYLFQKAQERTQISCTAELIDFCKTAMGALKDEEFRVCYLDAQNRIIAMETIQEGIVNQAVVYPRKVLERALQWKASAIILVHNHPSGHVRPSDADIRLTRTIQETARTLDILVHDHLIIGENRFFSFREEGLMS